MISALFIILNSCW